MSKDAAPVPPSSEEVFRVDVSNFPADQVIGDPGDTLVTSPKTQPNPTQD